MTGSAFLAPSGGVLGTGRRGHAVPWVFQLQERVRSVHLQCLRPCSGCQQLVPGLCGFRNHVLVAVFKVQHVGTGPRSTVLVWALAGPSDCSRASCLTPWGLSFPTCAWNMVAFDKCLCTHGGLLQNLPTLLVSVAVTTLCNKQPRLAVVFNKGHILSRAAVGSGPRHLSLCLLVRGRSGAQLRQSL